MKPTTLATLGILTAAVGGLAAWTLTRDTPASQVGGRGLLFPDLQNKVNDVATVKVTRAENSFTVTRKEDGSWGITERGGYAAKFETVKAAIVGIAGLNILEPRTSNPANYEKIGVEDPTKAGATSMLVTMSDNAGKPLASVILGKPKTATGFNAPPDIYVRREGEAESWLVRPTRGGERLDIRADANEWVDRSIVQLPRDRIKSVTITHSDNGERVDVVKDKKEDANWRLADMPPGRELKYQTSADAVAGALSSMNLEDVKPAGEISFDGVAGAPAPNVATAEYRTWDGLVLIVRTAKLGDKIWSKYEARYEEPPAPAAAPTPVDNPDSPAQPEPKPDAAEAEKVRKEAEDLHARLSPWAFGMADWQSRNLTTRVEDLLKPLPGQSEPPPPMPEGIQPLVPEPTPPAPSGMGPAPAAPPPPPPG